MTYPVEHVTLELTAFCNLNCSFCPVHKMKRSSLIMDYILVQKIINENPQLTRINLNNWGEPLLYSRFFEVIDYINAKLPNCDIYFATNGTYLNDKKITGILSRNIKEIQFSLDAVGPAYEAIRGCDYSTTRILIEHFLERRTMDKPRVVIKAVLNKNTKNTIDDLFTEWLDKVDAIKLQPMLIKQKRELACPEPFDKHPVVLSDGRVVPCCADWGGKLTLGDAKQDTLTNIWNGNKVRQLRFAHDTNMFVGICAMCGEYKTDLCKERFK